MAPAARGAAVGQGNDEAAVQAETLVLGRSGPYLRGTGPIRRPTQVNWFGQRAVGAPDGRMGAWDG